MNKFIEITECWTVELDQWQESEVEKKLWEENEDDLFYDFAFEYDVFSLAQILINADKIKYIKPKYGVMKNTLEFKPVTQIFFENDDYVIAIESYDEIISLLKGGENNETPH